MAAQSGQENSDVALYSAGLFDEILRRMRTEPFSFSFFQAVWLLERMRPDGAAVGRFSEPRREVVRFGAYPSLVFPASEIQTIDWKAEPPQMVVNFMGLTGPSGVLPRVYTELIEERGKLQDRSLRDFLDILNHRLISLFYRAWARSRFPIEPQRLRQCLLSLVGLGLPALECRQTVEDDSVAFYCGLFALQSRSAAALERILADYFQAPVEIVQFVGAWYRLGDDSTCRFGDSDSPSEVLGEGVVVGDAVFDLQSRARIRLGPLSLRQYEEFLPGRLGYRRLRDITKFFSRGEFDFEVQLILRQAEVPDWRMEDDSPVQLGWTTWMKTRPVFPRSPEDTVLALN
jgi:type VI secretion system protein ImpH